MIRFRTSRFVALYFTLVWLVVLCTTLWVTKSFPYERRARLFDVSRLNRQEGLQNPRTTQIQQSDNYKVPTYAPQLTIDILSVASKTRLQYAATQEKTWANHKMVRHFIVATEDDDDDPTCAQHMTSDQVYEVSKWCVSTYANNPDFWMMNRFSHFFARAQWLEKKVDPAGWLCAQKRFPIGLAKAMKFYLTNQETLPDYLMIVDDDTYYNLGMLEAVDLVNVTTSQDPLVTAGCRITNGEKKVSITFPFGGFGLVLSQGSLERLNHPMDCNGGDLSKYDKITMVHPQTKKALIHSIEDYNQAVCEKVQQNFIGERQHFTDGIRVWQLMEAFARAERFRDYKQWNMGFCFHGDFFLSYIVDHYYLSKERKMETFRKSEIDARNGDDHKVITGICKEEVSCIANQSLACHYQRPDDLQRLHKDLLQLRPHEFKKTSEIR